jgi:hypothetical protein
LIYYLSLECKFTALIDVHLQILKGGLEGREGKYSITTYKILPAVVSPLNVAAPNHHTTQQASYQLLTLEYQKQYTVSSSTSLLKHDYV